MAVQRTNLYLRLRAINPNFKGDPQQFAEAIAAAMEIVAPFGITTFVTGATQPISNQGPWLKDGKEWWVWDDDQSTYIPLTIDNSLPNFYYAQQATPPTNEGIFIWFRFNSANEPAGVYFLIGGQWTNIAGVPDNGPTANRPATPYDFQKYYDTDISALLWYERGAWRTVDGVRGDLKYVDADTQAQALARNPGWEIFGTGQTNNVNYRGKALAPALKDKTGANALTAPAGVTARSAWELYGVEEQVLTNEQLAGYLTHIHGYAKDVIGSDDTFKLKYTDFQLNEADYGTPAYSSHRENIDNGLVGAAPDYVDCFTTWPVHHPDNAIIQEAVQMAEPTIALFLLRKT